MCPFPPAAFVAAGFFVVLVMGLVAIALVVGFAQVGRLIGRLIGGVLE